MTPEEFNDKLFSQYESQLGTEEAAHVHETCRQYLENIQKIRNGTKVVVRLQLVDGSPPKKTSRKTA